MIKRRFPAFLAALFLWLSCAQAESLPTFVPASPSPAVSAAPGDTVSPLVRVKLESLGAPTALGLTLDGSYSVDGDRGFQFERGAQIALGVEGGSIVLSVGGAAIDMGSSFTLVRHIDEEGAGGAYIHEAKKFNLYCGDLKFSVRYGALEVIVTLTMEDYLLGVVPYEMSDTFPLEALKAQAVAARSYAMGKISTSGDREYDLVDTTNDQVFFGYDERFLSPIQAVKETEGLVGMYQGAYAHCFYSASNGGQTALSEQIWSDDGDYGYLAIADDPYDLENPQSVVKTAQVPRDARQMKEALYAHLVDAVGSQLSADGILTAGDAVGLSQVLSVTPLTPKGSEPSRQYSQVAFEVLPMISHATENEDGSLTYGEETEMETPVTVTLSYYTQVRTALGIGINAAEYDLFEVEETEDAFVFTARRYGHGVGMSQRGAQQMAGVYGMSFEDILAFYYPGMTLTQLTWEEATLTEADALPESLGYAAPQPTPAPTAAPLRALNEGEYYAQVSVEGVDSTLNVREEPSLSGRLLGALRNGSRMIIQEETGDGWAKMMTMEMEGYVNMSFIVKEEAVLEEEN